MTTAAPSNSLVTIQPAFTDAERLALAGFLVDHRAPTREAYTLDLRQFTTWRRARSLALFACFATDAKRGQLAELELRHRRRARCRNPSAVRRTEPALVRDRCAGLRTAGLDAAAGLRRGRPPLGDQTAPLPVLRRRRPPRQQRPPPAPSARRTMALGRWDHRRGHPPAGHPVRLTSRNSPHGKEGEITRPAEPRPPGATAGQRARPGTEAGHRMTDANIEVTKQKLSFWRFG
jgi:hypothetical protein